MFHWETIALYTRCISSLSLLFRESDWEQKKACPFRHPLFVLLPPQIRILIPCLDHIISYTNISRDSTDRLQLPAGPGRMGQALNTSACMQLFFLRIKQEEYKQEFFRQMAFSNLSMRHQQLVNNEWSSEPALTGRAFQTWIGKPCAWLRGKILLEGEKG